MPRRVRAAYSRTRCLPSPEEITLRCVPACGEDFARSIPSGSPHKAKRRLCGGPGEVGIHPNGVLLRCPHLALPQHGGGAGLRTLAHNGPHRGQHRVLQAGRCMGHLTLGRATRGLKTRNMGSCTELGMGAGSFQCQPLQLLMVVQLQNILKWGDGIEQIAISFYASLGGNGGVFSLDKALAFEAAGVFCHRVFSHANRFANCFVAGPALVCFAISTAEQVGVDSQLAGTEAEDKDLVREWEGVLQGIGALTPAQPLSPPFVRCSTHSANFFLGTTNRLPIFRTGTSALAHSYWMG